MKMVFYTTVPDTTATYSVIYKQHAICSMGDRHHYRGVNA